MTAPKTATKSARSLWLLQVLPIAAIGLQSWADLVTELELLLGRRLLLHAAVSSGSLSMVLLILDLCAAFR